MRDVGTMKTKVTFILPAQTVGDATGGLLLGEFNEWNQAQGVSLKKRKDGSFKATMSLEAGQTYQYRYLLDDGRWVNDDSAKSYSHEHQTENCVITVPFESKSDEDNDDDLTKIRGIGNKISELLISENIQSFEDLANTTVEQLKQILDRKGNRSKIYDPTHWAEQAKLAANGKWDELKKFQATLKQTK